MNITVELPPPVNEELVQQSSREGISEMEHAALLLCLASAFRQEEPLTPFQNAVRVFISHHSLDAARVFSTFEDLIRVCVDLHDAGKLSQDFQAALASNGSQPEYDFLKRWRDITVHQSIVDYPLDVSMDVLSSPLPPAESFDQAQGRLGRQSASQQDIIDASEHVRALLAQWQSEDNTPIRPPIPTLPGETPTQALFRKWEEEDAKMTDEEREAEDRLWEDIETGQKKNGRVLRLRHLG